ncbi:hypothetical protein A6V27_15625 [Hafnia alvei]|nr:hypothetical protein A6V27_15625 [Hafnia alvei]
MNAVHIASKMTTSPVIVLIKNRINFPATIMLKCTLHILARQVQPIFNNRLFYRMLLLFFQQKRYSSLGGEIGKLKYFRG